ncbi:MAG TPA: hypothetical protein VI423_11280 [Paenisporosarcina sp.]|nr:hypothetical protein [Paenisporosarcina sp.]
MQNRNATYYIEHLNMEPHPEGGHYARSFYSDIKMNIEMDTFESLHIKLQT